MLSRYSSAATVRKSGTPADYGHTVQQVELNDIRVVVELHRGLCTGLKPIEQVFTGCEQHKPVLCTRMEQGLHVSTLMNKYVSENGKPDGDAKSAVQRTFIQTCSNTGKLSEVWAPVTGNSAHNAYTRPTHITQRSSIFSDLDP